MSYRLKHANRHERECHRAGETCYSSWDIMSVKKQQLKSVAFYMVRLVEFIHEEFDLKKMWAKWVPFFLKPVVFCNVRLAEEIDIKKMWGKWVPHFLIGAVTMEESQMCQADACHIWIGKARMTDWADVVTRDTILVRVDKTWDRQLLYNEVWDRQLIYNEVWDRQLITKPGTDN